MFDLIFSRRPNSWGTRGDPFLWDALGWHLSSKKLKYEADPLNLTKILEEVQVGFTELSNGHTIADGRRFRLDWLPSGGMSGGCVSADTWRDVLLPEIGKRAQAVLSTDRRAINYHPAEHRFRFAAWCASSAARQSHLCRFSVETGSKLLMNSPVRWLALGPHWLPEKAKFDEQHEKWCDHLVQEAQAPKERNLIKGEFTYGVAAKLVNCFVKALFIKDLAGTPFDMYSENDDAFDSASRLSTVHPPIDRILLNALQRADVGGERKRWMQLKNKGWSKFDKQDYQEAIALVWKATEGEMWRIEKYWIGYQ